MNPSLRRALALPSAAALVALVVAGVRCSPCPTTADLARSEAEYAAAVVVACPVATYPALESCSAYLELRAEQDRARARWASCGGRSAP